MSLPPWLGRYSLLALIAAAALSPAWSAEKKAAGSKSAPVLDPAAEAALDRMSAFYKGVKAFSVKTTFSLRGGEEAQPAENKSTYTVQKPNRLAADISAGGQTTTVRSDGTTLYILSLPAKTYFKTEAPPIIADVLRGMAPGLENLLTEDPKAALLDDVRKVSVAGKEKIDSVECLRLHFEQENADVDVWIQTGAQPLLRRVSAKEKGEGGMSMDLRYDWWQINPKVTPATFAFTPPKDAKLATSEEEDSAPDGLEPDKAEPEKVEPVKYVPGASLQADFDKLHHAWAERALIAPFYKRLKGATWDEQAAKFVEKAVDDLGYRRDEETTAALAEAGKKVVAAGCNDPLVVYLAARIAYRVDDDWGEAFEAYKAVTKKLESDKSFGRALLCFVGRDYPPVKERGNYDTKGAENKVIEWTREALIDGSYGEDDGAVFLQHQMGGQWQKSTISDAKTLLERNPEGFMALYEEAELAEWVKCVLRGNAEIKLAWKDRGSGYANTVTDTGWKSFREHLAKARAALVKSWELRPDRPEAAASMITVVRAGDSVNGETIRTWFDRSTAAQFDYIPAYDGMLWAYQPRWGGSHMQMLAFGKACAASKRFETPVPLQLYEACRNIARERDDRRAIYRQPEAAKALIELSKSLIEASSSPSQMNRTTSLLPIYAWAGGDYALAAKALEAAPAKLHKAALEELQFFDVAEAYFRGEIAVYSSPARADFEKALALHEQADLDGARQRFELVAKKAGEKAGPFINAKLALTAFEKAAATGEWVKLNAAPALLEWNIRSGDWSADDSGALVNKGTDDTALILYRGRLGQEFEIRGDFEILATDNCCKTLGIAYNWHRNPDARWATCNIGQGGRSAVQAYLNDSFARTNEPKVSAAFQPKNQFVVRSRGGKLTFELNGKALYNEHQTKALTSGSPDALLGFGSFRFCKKNTTKITNIEVRRLPTDSR